MAGRKHPPRVRTARARAWFLARSASASTPAGRVLGATDYVRSVFGDLPEELAMKLADDIASYLVAVGDRARQLTSQEVAA